MNPALPNVPRSSVVRAATGAPPAELTCRRTRSPGANPLPEKPTRCAAFTAYGLTLIVGYRPSIWNGALAAEPLLLPTMKMLLGPTGPIPTFTPTLPTDPPPSACSVALGSPVTRPQYTPRSSPEPKPFADSATVSPGLPAAADSVAWAVPCASTASALATLLLLRCWAVTSRVVSPPLTSEGNGKAPAMVPSLLAVTVASCWAFCDLPLLSSRSTREPGSKPDPLTATVDPARTRPGLSVMSGWPLPGTMTPSRLTVGGGGFFARVLAGPPGLDPPGKPMPNAGRTERPTLNTTNSATAARANFFQDRLTRPPPSGTGSVGCLRFMFGLLRVAQPDSTGVDLDNFQLDVALGRLPDPLPVLVDRLQHPGLPPVAVVALHSGTHLVGHYDIAQLVPVGVEDLVPHVRVGRRLPVRVGLGVRRMAVVQRHPDVGIDDQAIVGRYVCPDPRHLLGLQVGQRQPVHVEHLQPLPVVIGHQVTARLGQCRQHDGHGQDTDAPRLHAAGQVGVQQPDVQRQQGHQRHHVEVQQHASGQVEAVPEGQQRRAEQRRAALAVAVAQGKGQRGERRDRPAGQQVPVLGQPAAAQQLGEGASVACRRGPVQLPPDGVHERNVVGRWNGQVEVQPGREHLVLQLGEQHVQRDRRRRGEPPEAHAEPAVGLRDDAAAHQVREPRQQEERILLGDHGQAEGQPGS